MSNISYQSRTTTNYIVEFVDFLGDVRVDSFIAPNISTSRALVDTAYRSIDNIASILRISSISGVTYYSSN